ncbi:MAG TPA: hypothetical protein ENN68_05695 [Methanomicrobia archaeon]|nr:hypothetical protein [Methanomicrobia archaeon]
MAAGMPGPFKLTCAAGIILTGVLLLLLVCGCIAPDSEPGNAAKNNPTTTATPALTTTPTTAKAVPDTIRVIKFQPTRVCHSCLLLGNYAKETIEVYFPAEYAAGKITYETVNYQDPKNDELVRKYGAMGSSLFITVMREGEEEIYSANDMWGYIGDKEEYMTVFKAKLDALMAGEDYA